MLGPDLVGCTGAVPATRPSPPVVDTTPAPLPFSTAPAVATLHLIHVGDTEAGMIGDDLGVGGVARGAAIIDALGRRAGHALVVHGGDTIIPSPELAVEFPWPVGSKSPQRPLLTANNALGLQVAALGNHDFDLGESFLADVIKRATYPHLASTLTVSGGALAAVVDDGMPWLGQPGTAGRLLRRARTCLGTLRDDVCDGAVVGVVAAVPESLRVLSGGASINCSAPVDAAGTIAALQPHIAALRAAGATIIVLLSHRQDAENDIALVSAGLVDVDVIVSGGGENRLAAPGQRITAGDVVDPLCATEVHGCWPVWRMARDGAAVAIVATDGGLRTVGALDVTFDGAGHITGTESGSRPWPVDEESLLELRAEMNRDLVGLELATTDALAPMLEVVGHVDEFLEGTRELVRNQETNLGSLSADALLAAALGDVPDVVAAFRNGGAVRDSIGMVDKSGARRGKDITVLDVKSALRFDSAVVVVDLSHADLARTIESSLVGAGTGQGRFPQVSRGVHLSYRAAGTDQQQQMVDGKAAGVIADGTRLQSLTVQRADGVVVVVVADGQVVDPAATIRIATIDYLVRGGDGWFPGSAVKTTPTTSSEQRAFRAMLARPDAVAASLRITGRITRLP